MTESRRWNVWSAADQLEAVQSNFYPNLTPRVVSIVREWGRKWDGHPEWRSLLNKHKLHHELEESIVAIHHLFQATGDGQVENGKKIIVMDICAGKGLFSFLLSYLKPSHVTEIVMLEKAAINWYHILHGANPTASEEGRPPITIWSNTNLHDYDAVLDRMVALPSPLALTGIHLCKQLGPSFCGLVNGLGSKCVYALLAPCCMPRAVTAQKYEREATKQFTLSVQLSETDPQRQERREYMERRGRLKRKPTGGPCFVCHDEKHGIVDCPVLPTLPRAEQITIRRSFHVATIPCWNCLQYGHYKGQCPEGVVRSTPLAMQTPQVELDVSRVLKSSRPFREYCHILADSLQDRCYTVVESELDNDEKHQDGNWNSERKSIFIVAK